MQTNILSASQLALLPLIEQFHPQFYLAGGTALALQYGHRHSIDFDLFSTQPFDIAQILHTIKKGHKVDRIFLETPTELTLSVDRVKLTFWQYPYQIDHKISFDNISTLPSPLVIGAMKALVLGRRAKWKDYLDLYFILQNHNMSEIIMQAQSYFGTDFDEKLFRGQLAYHHDIDYSEEVIFSNGFDVDKETVFKSLIKHSLS